MAHVKNALQRYHETHFGGGYINWHHYATNDTKAELLTDGYFNASVDALRVGDIIEAMVDADGTPAFARTRVTAATAGSDVTVVELL